MSSAYSIVVDLTNVASKAYYIVALHKIVAIISFLYFGGSGGIWNLQDHPTIYAKMTTINKHIWCTIFFYILNYSCFIST